MILNPKAFIVGFLGTLISVLVIDEACENRRKQCKLKEERQGKNDVSGAHSSSKQSDN